MTTKTTPEIAGKKNNWKYVWNHKLVFFLLIIIIVGAVWASIEIFSLKRSFNKEKLEITNRFVDETSRVFSWAIRSELLRDNKEQVNQFFMNLVKEPGYKKIQLIDASSSTVIISTDKKDEGATISDTTILNANNSKQLANGELVRSITPVMGLNSRIAVLVIDRELPLND